MTDGGSAYTV